MRFKNKQILQNKEIIVLPRPGKDGENDLVFIAVAVLDYKMFDKFCTEPKPPMITLPGGVNEPKLNDPGYVEAMQRFREARINWMVIQSLKATPELEWEKVKEEDWKTWHLYREELEAAGINKFEIGRIELGVMTANSLNEEKLELARERFLQRVLQPVK